MFNLDHTLIKLMNVNPRTEKHGQDDVLAVDLKIEWRTSNDVLAKFSPTLKDSLYCKAESPQGELVEEVQHTPNLRHPFMGAFKWALEIPCAEFRVHHGIRDDNDIVFAEAKVNHFAFECQEGGTIAIFFRVQVLPDEIQIAKLMTLLNKEVHVSLEITMPTIDDDDDSGTNQSLDSDPANTNPDRDTRSQLNSLFQPMPGADGDDANTEENPAISELE